MMRRHCNFSWQFLTKHLKSFRIIFKNLHVLNYMIQVYIHKKGQQEYQTHLYIHGDQVKSSQVYFTNMQNESRYRRESAKDLTVI